MNGNFLLLANEIWIKLDRMIVDLKSLKGGFQYERNWHEDWDHREHERHREEMWDTKFYGVQWIQT
jgi:hypothetical protein